MNEQQMTEIRRLVFAGGLVLIVFGTVFAIGSKFHIFNAHPQAPIHMPSSQPAATTTSKGTDTSLYVMDSVLILAGVMMMVYGRKGMAEAVPNPDPQQAKPKASWNSALDRAFEDAVSQSSNLMDVFQPKDTKSTAVVKVRCLQCQSLNDENAKFCSECGKPMS